MFSEVRASTSSQTTASEGAPRAASSACSAVYGDERVDVLHRDRALAVDPELLQVADDHAGVLAGDVAEDHVALRLVGGARQVDQVAGGRRGLEQVQGVLGVVAGRDDPQMDHAASLDD